MPHYDALILGAGAAGLFCAMHAARRGKRIAVADHAQTTGKKLRITGGGRCNFGNASVTTQNFLGVNPRFTTSALARFGPMAFRDFMADHGLTHYEEPGGKLFCTQGAQAVADLLEARCQAEGVAFLLGRAIEHVEAGQPFRLRLGNETVSADSLVVALGGPAWPQVGATSRGHLLAQSLGFSIVAARPALAPLQLGTGWPYAQLAGIALPVTVSLGKTSFTEAMLFTHQGLSGPAILQISSYWRPGDTLSVNLLPGVDAAQAIRELAQGNTLTKTALARLLPARLAQLRIPEELAVKPVAQLKKAELALLAKSVGAWEVMPGGTAGYKKAEVTAGGVATGQLSSKTMEAKSVAGLYFVGEVMDVTGHLGGYNLHWAFASGLAAALAL